MVNHQQLQKASSEFLNKKILAVGIFDVSLSVGKRNVAPAAAGVATYVGTRFAEKKMGKADKSGSKVVAAAVGVAGAVGTSKLIKTADAVKNGLTPIMIVAVTSGKIYLLNWIGTHNMGKGPTKVLMEFSRNYAKIETKTRGLVHHTVEITEGDKSVKIECNMGATHSNKEMNRQVIDLLKQKPSIKSESCGCPATKVTSLKTESFVVEEEKTGLSKGTKAGIAVAGIAAAGVGYAAYKKHQSSKKEETSGSLSSSISSSSSSSSCGSTKVSSKKTTTAAVAAGAAGVASVNASEYKKTSTTVQTSSSSSSACSSESTKVSSKKTTVMAAAAAGPTANKCFE